MTCRRQHHKSAVARTWHVPLCRGRCRVCGAGAQAQAISLGHPCQVTCPGLPTPSFLVSASSLDRAACPVGHVRSAHYGSPCPASRVLFSVDLLPSMSGETCWLLLMHACFELLKWVAQVPHDIRPVFPLQDPKVSCLDSFMCVLEHASCHRSNL